MPGTIVVVDAEPVVRTTIRRILERGLHGDCAGLSEKALALIRNHTPDLAITNVSLPGFTKVGPSPPATFATISVFRRL
jgi:CheY-like chemotaxis protein